jgi:hypothetical protein
VRRHAAGLLLGLALAGAAGAQGHAAHGAPRAARPQLGSSVAFAPDGRLWLVGVDAQGQLFVQTAPAPALQSWSAPRRLDTAGDVVAADGENRPKLAFGPQGQVVVSYTQPRARPYTGWIRLLRSADGGQTFAAPHTVHADRQEITHRFESIAFDGQGVLHTVWIDKRDLESAPRVERRSSYRGAAIYRNESRDGGLTFGPDYKLADHSCECCRIALARGDDGRLRAMWRHVYEPNVRDHALAVLGTHAAPVRATYDGWQVDGCPHHGPGLAPAHDGGWHTVWFGIRRSGDEDVAAVRYARLDADGSPRAPSVRVLPDEAAEHADVLADGLRVAVVWRSIAGARSTLKAWLSADGGQTFTLRELAQLSGDNDHPRLAQHAGRMVVVWRNPQEVQVHELRF